MAVRDFFGGVASVFLMLAKIVLCLMFALYDRLVEDLGATRRTVDEDASPVPALERS